MAYTNRRNFIRGTALSSAGAALGIPGSSRNNSNNHTEVTDIQDSRLKELITVAVDAAVETGASYADARLSHTEFLHAFGSSPIRNEHMGFGVRAVVNGFWGFAASPVWNKSEAARLGRAATAQAKSHSLISGGREMDLAPMKNLESGHWVMPIKEDPFEMSYDEIHDFMGGLHRFISKLEKVDRRIVEFRFYRKLKVYGSSLGQYNTQKLYRSEGDVILKFGGGVDGIVETLSPAGMGFELFRERPVRETIREVHEESLQILALPEVPLDVGRYETLINNKAVADLVSKTIGKPTEVDTAFGHEANAGGVGFIDPIEMLGSFKIGHSLLNITGDRSRPGSVGLVKWDDEGVEPSKFDIVKEGVVVGMQCNREGAGWIKDYLTRAGKPLQSVGCAYAPDAIDVPMVHNVDLTITPSDSSDSLDSLRKGIKKGIELKSPIIDIDFQCITGFTMLNAFELRDGKRIARLAHTSMLFRTPELWSNMIGIAGPDSSSRFGIETKKGEPMQTSAASVYSVPVVFKEMTFIGTR